MYHYGSTQPGMLSNLLRQPGPTQAVRHVYFPTQNGNRVWVMEFTKIPKLYNTDYK